MKFTNEQLEAIEVTEKNILVSAAAGSGKTAVLVERIINIILDGKSDIDNMLIVTFTNAAASEIKAKIIKAIKAEMLNNPSKKKELSRQLDNVYKAYISTFHSFAIKIIKEFYNTIDLEPDFKVCDEVQSAIMQNEVINEIFNEGFINDQIIKNSSFVEFLKVYSSDRNEEQIMQEIVENYNQLRSIPNYFKWAESKCNNTSDSEIINKLKITVYERLLEAKSYIDKALYVYDLDKVPSAKMILESDKILIKQIIDMSNDIESEQFFNEINSYSFDRLVIKKEEKSIWKDIEEEVKAYREAAKETLNKLKKSYFYDSLEEQLEELKKCHKYANYYLELLKLFEERYSVLKSNQGLMDFSDIEHKALEILKNQEIAETIKARLNYIFIDEYQDTNYIQEELISKVSRDNNLFKVGDVKQSIYGFRQAEPKIFMDTRKNYQKADNSKSIIVDLNKNFRSKGKIIDFINHVFQSLMEDYDDDAKLYEGVPYKGVYNQKPELHIISMEDNGTSEAINYLDKVEVEAKATAKVISEKLGKDFHDSKEDIVRPLEPRDVVILLRSTKNQAEKYYKELLALGINSYVSDDDGYFNTIEINAVFELLNVLDNMKQDVSLISVLHSEMFCFNAEELGLIRANKMKGAYWEAFLEYIENGDDEALKTKCAYAKDKLISWKLMASIMSIDKFLWNLLIESNYYLYVGTLPRGKQRQANLRALVDKALDFQVNNLGTIHDFVSYLNVLKTKKVRTGQAKIFGEEDNLVRIMTVHKSKGLEFPCVILAGLGKKLVYSNLKTVATINSKVGIGLPYIDKEKGYKRKTILQKLISTQINKEEYEEQLRVLYVAMTRAREQLIMMALESDLPQKDVDISKSSYLKILGSLLNSNKIDVIYENGINDDKSLNLKKADRINALIEKYKLLYDEKIYEDIKSRLEFEYEFKQSEDIKSKYSVSELNEQMKNSITDKIDKIKLEGPKFNEGKHESKAAEVGNIYHKIMELIDFRKMTESKEEYVGSLCNELIDKKIIDEETFKKVDIKSICNFFDSELGKECINAAIENRLYKEKPFTMKMMNKGEEVLVQGIIDCYFVKDEEIVLLDYKSNSIRSDIVEEEEKRIKDIYKKQMDIYKDALEKGLNKKVKSSYLYLFSIDKLVEM